MVPTGPFARQYTWGEADATNVPCRSLLGVALAKGNIDAHNQGRRVDPGQHC